MDELENINKRIARATQAVTRNEIEREAAQKAKDVALAKLKAEFDLDTAEEAEKLLKQLDKKLKKELEKIDEALRSIDA